MATDVDIYNLDKGVIINLDTKIDISAAIAYYMLVKRMSTGIVTQVIGILSGTQLVKYTVPATGSPFADDGRYQIRSKVKWDASQEQQGDPVELVVGESWTTS